LIEYEAEKNELEIQLADAKVELEKLPREVDLLGNSDSLNLSSSSAGFLTASHLE